MPGRRERGKSERRNEFAMMSGCLGFEGDMPHENETNIAQVIRQVDDFHDRTVIGDGISLHELQEMRARLVEIQRVKEEQTDVRPTSSSRKTKTYSEEGGWEERARALQREYETLLEENLVGEEMEEIRERLYKAKVGDGRQQNADEQSIATADSTGHSTGSVQPDNKTEKPSSSTDSTRTPNTNSILHQIIRLAITRKSLIKDLKNRCERSSSLKYP